MIVFIDILEMRKKQVSIWQKSSTSRIFDNSIIIIDPIVYINENNLFNEVVVFFKRQFFLFADVYLAIYNSIVKRGELELEIIPIPQTIKAVIPGEAMETNTAIVFTVSVVHARFSTPHIYNRLLTRKE